MASIYGVSAYQQAGGTSTDKTSTAKTNTIRTDKANDTASSKKTDDVKTSTWKPLDTGSSLVPSVKNGYGNVIGDVELSDKAKEYYSKLKAKFGNMDFILVSKDMKAQVQANASAYGNAYKQVVLIDDEKLEKMATDESYRKKYEGIIAMSQTKLAEAKNSLASSGASIMNFGMSVGSDGKTTYFATLEKKRAEKKAIEKKNAKKKEQKLKDKKAAMKRQEKLDAEKAMEEKRAEKDDTLDTEYVEITADSFKELNDKVYRYAYDDSSNNVLTDKERQVGQHFDFKW